MKATRQTSLLLATLLLPLTLPAQSLPASASAAIRLVRQGRIDEALPLVERELAKQPKNVALLHFSAYCKGRLGRHADAIVDANAAIAIDPRHASSYGERAYCLFHLGKVTAALADYDKSIELDPENAMVHGERGDALLELGRHRQAIAAYDQAIRLLPEWPNAHSQRGRAALALCDFELARASFARAHELDPDDGYSVFALAGAQFDCGLADEALATAKDLARAAGESRALALRGRLAWQLDRYDLAKQDLAEAVKTGSGPELLDARLSLGILLLSLGEAQAAVEAMPFDEDLERDAEFGPWLALMRWCARGSVGSREVASKALAEELAAYALTTDDTRAFADLLTGKASASAFEVAAPDRIDSSCSALFFAGFRAALDGEKDRSDALLLQCVQTGHKYAMQWQAARTMLLQRHGPDAFAVSPGASFSTSKVDDRDVLVVERVADAPAGAARWQGLHEGDVVVRVSDAAYEASAIERAWAGKRVGHDVHLTIRRDGKESVVSMRLGWQRR